MHDAKQVEWYSQATGAWFSTSMEHDKSILTLSVAGIGVLIGLMQTAIDSVCALLIYIAALVAFLTCIVLVLIIFKKNKDYILAAINDSAANDKLLGTLDFGTSVSFFVAVFLSAILGLSSAITTYSERSNKMTADDSNGNSHRTNDSANGCGNLRPSNESFQGLEALKPRTQPQEQASTINQANSAAASRNQTKALSTQDGDSGPTSSNPNPGRSAKQY